MSRSPGKMQGFTLIELLVVMAIIAVLLSLVSPKYFNSIGKAEETVLRENLFQIRDALDHYYQDNEHYPLSLEELVSRRYLRKVPLDPVTQRSDTWVLVSAQEPETGIADIRSGAKGTARDGTAYGDW